MHALDLADRLAQPVGEKLLEVGVLTMEKAEVQQVAQHRRVALERALEAGRLGAHGGAIVEQHLALLLPLKALRLVIGAAAWRQGRGGPRAPAEEHAAQEARLLVPAGHGRCGRRIATSG